MTVSRFPATYKPSVSSVAGWVDPKNRRVFSITGYVMINREKLLRLCRDAVMGRFEKGFQLTIQKLGSGNMT